MNQKRVRSNNWDEEEKQLFLTVLREYSDIIENKSLDTNSNTKKNKAWEEVYKKFNGLNKQPRQLSQLKIQWKTMKINARKTCSTFNKKVNKIGGGARPRTHNDAVTEIKDLLYPAELLRDHNIYDSDGIISKQSSKSLTETGLKSRKVQNEYARSLINHSKTLKDEEHRRRMEMAEEEHSIKMAIHMLKIKHHRRQIEMAEKEHAIKMAIHRDK